MEEKDKRFDGDTRYIEEGMKLYKAYERERTERKSGKGIFTAATVERYMGEER